MACSPDDTVEDNSVDDRHDMAEYKCPNSAHELLPIEACTRVKDKRRKIKTKTKTKLEKWFPLWGERAHSLKLFCMYDKRFEI